MMSSSPLERRFGWLSFPGFLRYYALFHVLVYGLHLFRPELEKLLDFDRAKIFSGEIWRLLTFLVSSSASLGGGTMGMIAMLFLVMVAFMMSEVLEEAWGAFKTSIFYYGSIFGLIIANFLFPHVMDGSGFLFYGMAFFAFATLHPKVEFLLFFIIPVQVRFLAWFQAVGMLISIVGNWRMLPFLLIAHAAYLGFVGLPALFGKVQAKHRDYQKRKFYDPDEDFSTPFHTCTICHRDDRSNPELDFRISSDGKEYCEEHLPN